MSSPLLDSHMLPFSHFDSYGTSTEEEVVPLESPKPIVAPAPKRKNKVTKKRKRVGRACVFCQRSHMSCDEQRPCKRCVARGCGDQCRDGKRKRRGRKRKTPLPDGENSLDDEFDEFEPADKQFKDDTDTEDEFDAGHAHCNHGDDVHDHHHHAAPVPASAANFNSFKLFDDDEESSLSNSSATIMPVLKIKSEFEPEAEPAPLLAKVKAEFQEHADSRSLKTKNEMDHEDLAPSRPTTPALPIPMRNPRVVALSQNTSSSSTLESSSPATNQPSFEAMYPSFFEPCEQNASSAPAIDVDSFFASEPQCGSASRMPMTFFEATPFGEADACF